MSIILNDILNATVMGIVEGLTEFLPVSSTGHLILTSHLLGMTGQRTQVFTIAIQTGAILALCLYYWRTLWATLKGLPREQSAQRFTLNIAIAFFPAVVLGLTLGSYIKAALFNPTVVASTFIVGGFIILWAERRNQLAHIASVQQMSAWDALKVGLVQCLALIPGTSRSGATIIGGMLLGLQRSVATEFSFFLAIPTLLGAAAYDVFKHRSLLTSADAPLFGVGIAVSFVTALLVIRWLLRYVASHTFAPFAWYRIAFGIVVLITAHMGWVVWAN
jgi:undecaprenyl-diphosphatase